MAVLTNTTSVNDRVKVNKMIKYKRRTINQKTELHDKYFVVYEDIEAILDMVVKAAVDAGADKDKLMEFFSEKD